DVPIRSRVGGLTLDMMAARAVGAGRSPHAKTSGQTGHEVHHGVSVMSLAEVASVNAGRAESDPDVTAVMLDMGRRASAAARALALATTEQKDRALAAMAQALRARRREILAANAEDVAAARAAGMSAALVDRLALDDKRLDAMADGIDVVKALADPVGQVTESWTRPNGMRIERLRVPLRLIRVLYD